MARENQGLQIALIILFMLTIILGVTTYVFCRQYIEADESARKLDGQLKEKDTANQSIQDENNQLKKMILGVAGAEDKKLEEITTQFNQDREKFAAGFDDQDKFYRPLVLRLYDTVSKKTGELTDANDALQALRDDYVKWKKEMTGQVEKHDEARLAAEDKLKNVTAMYDAARAQIDAGKEKIQADWDKTREETDKRLADLGTERDNANAKAKKLETLVDTQGKQLDKLGTEAIGVPDGKITWVDQRTGTVWIDLGRADALRRQTTFSVYPIDITNLAKGGKKASIEVTRILSEHLAEARIVEDTVSDPIMIGDKIYTPVWNPGEQVRFALVGLMDIDGDGTSDRQTVQELIEMSGGKVDYWLDEKGNKNGEMTINTRYLVVDWEALEVKEQSDETKAKAADTQAGKYSTVLDEARGLGLKKITLGDLLQQMGWKSPTRLVRYGREANPKDFRPRAPEGGIPLSTGTVTDLFRPRRAPPGEPAQRGGAY